MSNIEISLNPDLDVGALAADYAVNKRGQVPGIFPRAVADEIHDILAEQVPWQLTYFDGQRDQYMDLETLRGLAPEERMRMNKQRMELASKGFAYSYNTFKFHEEMQQGRHLDHPLKAFDDFLSSPEMIKFIRAYVGDPEIQSGGGHATWFGPGHYLNIHTDKIPGVDRRCAFVFNFTQKWMPDWGGELKFYSHRAAKVEEAFLPAYNMLNVFTVPKPHSVGFVSPFAAMPRLAITGWFYAGDPPPRP